MRSKFLISSLALALVCTLATVGLFVNRAADAGSPGCPSDWPAQQASGQGGIDYNDFYTDGDGDRWFVIRSADSNGYATIRAYVADDGYASGYRAGSPDETCFLIVRRSGDSADVTEATQVTFRAEREPDNLPLVEELFASLSSSEISCIRSIIGTNPSLQSQRLMDDHNTLPVYYCIDDGKMYEDATIAFLVKLFALQDGGRSDNAVNCLIEVSTRNQINRELVHLRLGTVSMASFAQEKQFTLAAASNEMTTCMSLHEQILNLLNIVVKQDQLDRHSNGAYIIREIRASSHSGLQDCISSDVGDRLDEISGMTVIESFKHFENGELLNCLLLDQQTSAKVYAHVASSRAGISSPTGRLSPQTEACFETLADASSYRLLVTLAVDPQGVVDHSASFTADDAVLNSLVGRGLFCMTSQPMDLLTAFNSSNLALRPPQP